MKQRLWTRNYILILLAVFTAAVSDMTFLSVLPVHIMSIGGTGAVVGGMVMGMIAASVVTRLVCGGIMDRRGRRGIMLAGAVVYALDVAAFNFVSGVPALFALRVLCGVGQGMYFGAVGTMLADVVPTSRLVEGLGYFGVSGSLAGMFAPALGLAILEKYGAERMFLMTSVSAGASLLFAALLKSDYVPPTREKGERAALVEPTVFLPSAVSFLIVFSYGAIANFITACGASRGIAGIGVYFTVLNGAMIAVRFANGKLIALLGEFRALMGGIALTAAACLIASFAGSLAPMLLSGALCGLGMGISTPLLNALVFQIASPERRGAASATYGLFTNAGTGAGAYAWGWTAGSLGYAATYALSAVVVGGAAILNGALLRAKIKKRAA